MLCPRCQSESDGITGKCPRCGYQFSNRARIPGLSSKKLTALSNEPRTPEPVELTAHPAGFAPSPIRPSLFKAGYTLKKGVYYLTEEILLPENQQEQGAAWFAIDITHNRRRVIIRDVYYRGGEQPDINIVAQRQFHLSQYAGIPKVLDVFIEGGHSIIVQEQPDGESLATVLKRQGGALPERDAAIYGQRLCEILIALGHQHPPYIHGAISPGTIIINSNSKKVSLILLPLFLSSERPYTSKKFTSPGYTAPEQRHGITEPASDLFSVAAVLHHAVTGYPPQDRLNFFYPPVRRLNPRVSQEMEEILNQELRLSISHRYRGPSEMRKGLQALLATLPEAEPIYTPDKPIPGRKAGPPRLTRLNMALIGLSIILAIICIVGVLNTSGLIILFPGAQSSAAITTEMTLEENAFTRQGIGVSDGRFIFDTYTGRSDVTLKEEAAQAIQQGNNSQAINLLTQAVAADPTDGEAQIYNEDLHILQSGAPYVTIVLGQAIDKSTAHVISSRAALEAAYLAQNDTNTNNLLPDGLKLRILIDNSGAENSNVATAAQFIVNRVTKMGNVDHIIGVIGWPTSTQTINARDLIASAHIPLVSQTASTVALSGSSPYFFRVNPADDEQGKTLGMLGTTMGQTILVFHDTEDPYSVSLANGFSKQVEGNNVITIQDTFIEGTTTVTQYETIINNALQNDIGLIFLPGSDIDAVRLAYALGQVVLQHPDDPQLAALNILCSDAAASSLILGQGSGPDRDIAANNPQEMRHLLFTAFADPNESALLHLSQPAFFTEWASTYQSSAIKGSNAPSPTQAAILNYDAARVIVSALAQIHSTTPTGQQVRDMLTQMGHGKTPAYQGVSGKIYFDGQGNPVDKALVVLNVESGSNGVNTFHIKQIVGTYQ